MTARDKKIAFASIGRAMSELERTHDYVGKEFMLTRDEIKEKIEELRLIRLSIASMVTN